MPERPPHVPLVQGGVQERDLAHAGAERFRVMDKVEEQRRGHERRDQAKEQEPRRDLALSPVGQPQPHDPGDEGQRHDAAGEVGVGGQAAEQAAQRQMAPFAAPRSF